MPTASKKMQWKTQLNLHMKTTQYTGDGSQLEVEEYCSESAASATPQDISDGSSVEPGSDDGDH